MQLRLAGQRARAGERHPLGVAVRRRADHRRAGLRRLHRGLPPRRSRACACRARPPQPDAGRSDEPTRSAWARLGAEKLSLKELKTRIEIECITRGAGSDGRQHHQRGRAARHEAAAAVAAHQAVQDCGRGRGKPMTTGSLTMISRISQMTLLLLRRGGAAAPARRQPAKRPNAIRAESCPRWRGCDSVARPVEHALRCRPSRASRICSVVARRQSRALHRQRSRRVTTMLMRLNFRSRPRRRDRRPTRCPATAPPTARPARTRCRAIPATPTPDPTRCPARITTTLSPAASHSR